ncbi:MAG TPA: GNAT family N-acetyltransferase [Kofleriaceae bacterium]|nr:GNAT family N-acetyltransferase [Kofleriaceae bacterium]
MDWIISSDPSRVQLDVVHRWLAAEYWSPNIRREIVERAFANSLVFGAYRGAHQLGVARVVTDQATFAWLCDVFVDESARGQGIATAMVRAALDDPRLQTLRRWCLATRTAHAVYRPLGFEPVDARIWMQIVTDARRWSEVA